MSKIFISHRREDTSHLAGRLYDGLGRHFGFDSLYKDVDSIPRGADFRAHLEKAVGEAKIVLVLIGKRWLTVTDASGGRRLDAATDLVRKEIEFAIAKNLTIIPILTDYASMPNEGQLPASIRAIVLRNAALLRPDPDFRRDLAGLIEDLSCSLPKAKSNIENATSEKTFFKTVTIGIAVLSLAVIAVLGVQSLFPKIPQKPPGQTNNEMVQNPVGQNTEPDFLDDGYYSVELLVVKFVVETRVRTVNKTVLDPKTGVPRVVTEEVPYTANVPVTEKERFETRGFPQVKPFKKDGATYYKVTLRPSLDRTIILDVSQAPTSITKMESGKAPVDVAPPAIDDLFGAEDTDNDPLK